MTLDNEPSGSEETGQTEQNSRQSGAGPTDDNAGHAGLDKSAGGTVSVPGAARDAASSPPDATGESEAATPLPGLAGTSGVESGTAELTKPAPRRRATSARRAPRSSSVGSAGGEASDVLLAAPTVEVPAVEVQAEDKAAAVPTVGIMPLFQAPEPIESRPRRAASRPAGPPPRSEPASDADGSDDHDEADARAAIDDGSGPDLESGDEDPGSDAPRRRRRRGGRGRRGRSRSEAGSAEDTTSDDDEPPATDTAEDADTDADSETPSDDGEDAGGSRRRRRRRRRGGGGSDAELSPDDPPNTVVKVRESRRDDASALRGSTRLEAKKQRRREGREAGRRRTILSEAEFLARRESVERVMVVREREGRTQIGVLEDGVLVEHYVARKTQTSMVGNVYLGKVQNVLPSMEAAFVDIGKGRNAVLYAGEVNWDAAGLDGQPRRIEHALKSGESVLVQVTKDPIGHKGARLTSQISLPGRYLVLVPDGGMTGISRKLPDTERTRLKKILREVVPDDSGVIVRTAAEGASEQELQRDVSRLTAQWEDIRRKTGAVSAPALLYGEPDLAIRVVRDIFNEDFSRLFVAGDEAWDTLEAYIGHVAPDLVERLERWSGDGDIFAAYRIDEQLAKALDRKVYLPSGGSLVIDRTEAMTVVDVNTGKFTGAGGNLEETVTKNNVEAAEEVVRQLRLRDIGGIIVVDFIDMVLESNRELVLRRLLECLGRDRTRHQVAEVTSLGLVQMTRKRVGQGLLEVFSETCEHCGGRGLILHDEPVERKPADSSGGRSSGGRSRSGRNSSSSSPSAPGPAAAESPGGAESTSPESTSMESTSSPKPQPSEESAAS